MSDKKTYIPQWALVEIARSTLALNELNQYLYAKFPNVSKRTLRRYTRAYRDSQYTTELAKPSYTADGFAHKSVIPASYENYGWETYVERMRALIKRDRPIRFANVQDVHIETADPALLNLLADLLSFWQPDVVPVLCDVVDNVLFSKWRHGSSYHNQVELLLVDDDLKHYDSSAVAYPMFTRLSTHYIDLVRSAVTRSDLILPVILGNHEAWALAHINDNPNIASLFFPNFFEQLEKRNVLWVKSSTQRELPVTDNVIAVHGWSTRQEGNARSYLRYYEGMSVIAGHSHRVDVAYSKPNFNTNGRNFAAITGTLGTLRPSYRQGGHVNHDRAVQFIEIAPRGNVGHVVHTVYIHHIKDYYEARFMGNTFRVKTTRVALNNPFNELERERV